MHACTGGLTGHPFTKPCFKRIKEVCLRFITHSLTLTSCISFRLLKQVVLETHWTGSASVSKGTINFPSTSPKFHFQFYSGLKTCPAVPLGINMAYLPSPELCFTSSQVNAELVGPKAEILTFNLPHPQFHHSQEDCCMIIKHDNRNC